MENNKEIIQSNKIIAKFMDLVEDKDIPNFYMIDGILYNLRYHFSWDWLIPVIEKIETKGYVVNVSSCPSIEKSALANLHIRPYSKTQYTKGNRLKRTFRMVVEFINWYNKNK